MVTAGQLSAEVRQLLKDSGNENYIFDSKCIIEKCLSVRYETVITHPDTEVSSEAESEARTMADRRASGFPLQYLLGEWEFYGLPFLVGNGVLIPRQDTETLVDCVINQCSSISKPVIADLCSGSGCVPVALEKHIREADISAVELSDEAFEYLEKNIRLNSSPVKIFKGDVLNPDFSRNFTGIDIITSNPPYLTPDDMDSLQEEVKYEPEMALRGGSDGLLFYREITRIWKNCLKPGGMIFFETGINQDRDVASVLSENGFSDIRTYPDLCGINRVVSGVYSK